MSESNFSEDDIKLIKLINQIRAKVPSKRLRKKHLVLGFKFDVLWALKKSMQLYGEVDVEDYRNADFHDNIHLFRYHCMEESGIAQYLRLRVTEVIRRTGEKKYESIIGIAENTHKNRKFPPPSGIRKLMELLETKEAPEWYVVSADSY